MPLGLAARELELIIIAQDRASATIARVGGSLALLGASLTRVGIEGIRAFADMTAEAIEFDNAARLAFTQVFDKSRTTLSEVKDIMRNVAADVAAPFDELDEALFDIFSSLDVTGAQAEVVLRNVAQAAVAGQTDVRSAMIPTIAVMNAYGLSSEHIREILDIQFKTVQKGILTYAEFTANVGKAIPAAVAAGQEFSSLGGMIAFLTRQGLSAAMATVSAARALELLTKPQTLKNLRAQGIAITDQAGNFRQIDEIMSDLAKKFDGLTGSQRKKKFEEIFGSGTIQARRFFDVAIPNWEELNTLVDEFASSAGAMDEAYKIMFESPQTQLNQFTNLWRVFRTEVGDRFIPLLQQYVVPRLQQLWDEWQSLTEAQKTQIIQWAALGTAGVTVLGVLSTFLGLLTLAAYAWKGFATVGVAGLAVFSKFLIVGAAIGALGYYIYENWDKIGPVVVEVWKIAKKKASEFWSWATKLWSDEVYPTLVIIWEKVQPLWEKILMSAKETWPQIVKTVRAAVDAIRIVIEKIVQLTKWIWTNWGDEIVAVLKFVWDLIGDIVMDGLKGLEALFKFVTALLTGDWSAAWENIKEFFVRTWYFILGFFKVGILKHLPKFIKNFVATLAEIFGPLLKTARDAIFRTGGIIAELLGSIILSFGRLKYIFKKIWSYLNPQDLFIWLQYWSKMILQLGIPFRHVIADILKVFSVAVGKLKTKGQVVWAILKQIGKVAFGLIAFVFAAFKEVAEAAGAAWDWLVPKVKAVWGVVMKWWKKYVEWMAPKVKTAWDFIVQVWNTGSEIIATAVRNVVTFVGKMWMNAKDTTVKIFTFIRDLVKRVWESDVVQTIRNVIVIILHVIRIGWQFIQGIIEKVHEAIGMVIVEKWESLKAFLSTTWTVIKNVAEWIWTTLASFLKWLNTDVKNFLEPLWEGLKTFLKGVWTAIKTIAEPIWKGLKWLITEVVQVMWQRIVDRWNSIKSFLVKAWDFIKQYSGPIWDGIRRAIVDPIVAAWNKFVELKNKFLGWFGDLWEKAREWTGKIRESLSKLNPAEWFSPPLTIQTEWGMAELVKNVIDPLRGLHRTLGQMMPDIRESMLATTSIARPIAPLPTRNPFAASAPQRPEQRTGPLVNIEKLISTADPNDVARRIAWEIVVT